MKYASRNSGDNRARRNVLRYNRAVTMTNFDRGERDPRDTELRRAQEVAEALSARFPDDETIKESVEAIRKARERRAALPTRPRRINGYR